MRKSKFTEEQMAYALKQAELGIGVEEVCRKMGNTMLDATIDKVAASGERPIVHSDRGGHYRWPGWLARIADAKLVRSMSRKGCSPDNAACQGLFWSPQDGDVLCP